MNMKTFGIRNPKGQLETTTLFFTNRPDAADFAVSLYNESTDRRFGKDGSDLEWKKMKRQGWEIVPVEHVVVS